jgi:excisionase family DNA binding protein
MKNRNGSRSRSEARGSERNGSPGRSDSRGGNRNGSSSSPDAPAGSRFLSRGEVSQLFGVSPSTVTRWARLGLLKAARTPGGHYRFPAEETLKAASRAAAGELSRLD